MSIESTSNLVRAGLCAQAAVADNEPVRRKVGRFREARRTKLLRAALGGLSRVLPTLAAHVGYRMLATPPRVAERPWQRELRLQARVVRVAVGAGTVAVYEWGAHDGPTILMVHGWGARATQMGRMIGPLVSAGFRVVSFDAPAHGESTGRSADLVEFAGAVHQVARFAGPLAGVIAHSFGAAMAQLAARDWGVIAKRQVLISSIDHCGWICDTFGRYAGLTEGVVDRMKLMMVERHNGRFEWARTSVVDMLRQSSAATLLIHDEGDEEIPFQHSVALRDGCRNATLLATHGFGHHRLLADRSVIDEVVRFMAAC